MRGEPLDVALYGTCPFGGAHTVKMTVSGDSCACFRCHKAWWITGDGLLPVHPEPALSPETDR